MGGRSSVCIHSSTAEKHLTGVQFLHNKTYDDVIPIPQCLSCVRHRCIMGQVFLTDRAKVQTTLRKLSQYILSSSEWQLRLSPLKSEVRCPLIFDVPSFNLHISCKLFAIYDDKSRISSGQVPVA